MAYLEKTDDAIYREELGLLVVELRKYIQALRDLPFDVDPELVADQLEDLING